MPTSLETVPTSSRVRAGTSGSLPGTDADAHNIRRRAAFHAARAVPGTCRQRAGASGSLDGTVWLGGAGRSEFDLRTEVDHAIGRQIERARRVD